MRRKISKLGSNLEIIVTNSKAYNAIKKDWLQRGIINLIREIILVLLQKEKIKIDNLGRQIACPITNRNKILLIMIICRIPQGSN